MYNETSLSKTDYGWLFYQINDGISNSARLFIKLKPNPSLTDALRESFGIETYD